ncbi:glycosyltransferase [Actinomyces sp. MRS3W]|uniref:glycosyltransferase n=1 Tax=Actinomyces sp. MRS3W TaxID=2800796 RepID=UPI0028FD404A|nr:glycosyltransferase [Actinomyces sp. MRS3W]MDU0347453.1 glycosyltransferase [Actinomyces sp. MRS3W]
MNLRGRSPKLPGRGPRFKSALAGALGRLRRRAGGEEGQTLLLGVGLVAVVAALLLVLASATAVYLDLKTLTSLADSAAAAAADAVDEGSYFDGASTAAGPGSLSAAGVRAAAAADLATQPVDLAGLQIADASSPDGATAVVTLTAHSQPPFLPWGVIPASGFTITATGTARATTGM